MKLITLEQAADFLETATIEDTHDHGFAIIHTGTNAAGARFVLVNDCNENTMLTESM